ncbi:MAG TPA: ATP-binding protein, partial [Nitrospirota bacterium]
MDPRMREERFDAHPAQRKELEDRLALYRRSLNKLLDVSHAITVTTDLKKLYRSVIATARDLLSLDFSTLMILSEDKQVLTIMDTLGFPETMINTFHLIKGEGLATHVALSASPGVVDDFNTETRFEVPPIVIEKKITSAVCVPMMFKGEVLGVLIGHTLKRRTFPGEELSLYQNIANQAAVAVENSLHLKEQQRLTSIIENTSDFIGMATLEGKVFYLNPAGRALVGIGSLEDARQRDMAEYVMEEDRLKFQELLGRTRLRREWKGELRFRHFPTSRAIPVEMSLLLILDKEAGGPLSVAVIGRDLTDRKQMELELIRAQKLESLGVLAGGIAHDFNNLLTAVLGNIVLARTYAGSEKDIAGWMKEAERAAIRAKDLTKQLLTFSRGGLPVKEIVAIGPIIEEAAHFSLLGSRAHCEFSFPSDLWPVEADAGQISQVVSNLLINANQAMPEGGAVSIVCDNLMAGEQTTLPLQPGPYVRVMVKDAGIGMPREFLSKIFDPYFTTKQTGSGLGLATCYAIMKKHNGHIAVES